MMIDEDFWSIFYSLFTPNADLRRGCGRLDFSATRTKYVLPGGEASRLIRKFVSECFIQSIEFGHGRAPRFLSATVSFRTVRPTIVSPLVPEHDVERLMKTGLITLADVVNNGHSGELRDRPRHEGLITVTYEGYE